MILLLMQLAFAPPTPVADTYRLPLSEFNIVVDAGHGGMNPGVRYRHKDGGQIRNMVEKVYTCDIAARLIDLLRPHGANVGTTTRGTCLNGPRAGKLFSPWPASANEFFSTTGDVVVKSHGGLMERVRFARDFYRTGIDRRNIFISIHVDSSKSYVRGGFVMVPNRPTLPRLAYYILDEFEQVGITRAFNHRMGALVVNGTRRGFDPIFILRNEPTCETVLVEVANIGNREEQLALQNPAMRQRWARLLANAILRLARDPSFVC